MANRFNPFKPNHPIYTGLFAGRDTEIQKIDDSLYQTSYDNPTNLLFIGERGIGKTSLLLLAKYFSVGEVVWEKKKHNFIPLQITINQNTTLIDFVLKFKNTLQRELHKIYKTQKIIDSCWGFVKRLEISGFKISQLPEGNSEVLIDDFIHSLIDTVKSITCDKDNPKDGIVILIDEVDTASDSLKLGAFLKYLAESLASENCNRVLFILAGLPNATDNLRKSHESSLRLFEECELGPLKYDDVKEVIDSALEDINKNDPQQNLSFTDDAIKGFNTLSEGYPHFLQQIGFSTIANCDKKIIDRKDVEDAMFNPGGALELIGKRYYMDLFYNKINVDSYRQILTIMASKWNDWISKSEINKEFTGSGSNLNNGIKALRDRHIILTRKGVRGQYRLQWASFAFWIKIHTSQMKQTK